MPSSQLAFPNFSFEISDCTLASVSCSGSSNQPRDQPTPAQFRDFGIQEPQEPAMRNLPTPMRKIIDDRSNTERVLVGLDLRSPDVVAGAL
jgi:hypothetical protein